jgi:hypothetical protein
MRLPSNTFLGGPHTKRWARRFLIGVTVSTLTALGSSPLMAAAYGATPILAATVAFPTTIPANCSSDATAALNSFFAGLPPAAVVILPAGACFLVSNSTSSELSITGTQNVTIRGNGATFKQISYSGGNQVQPVLQIQENTNLTVYNLTVEGSAGTGGAASEGDYGIMVGSNPTGNNGVMMAGVTITQVEGDGLAVYPDLGVNTGINTNVTFQNGTLSHIGYHGVSLEGVNGFVFQGNAVTDVSNFMDLEVDSPCQGTTSRCYDLQGNPVGAAQWNVTVRGNMFTNGRGGEWIEEEQASCIPLKNLVLTSNHLDARVNPAMTLFGSSTTQCAPDSGLRITNNTSTDPASQGGTPNADISAFDFAHVTISANNWVAFDGLADYYPNTPSMTALNLCGVVGGTITNNTWDNFGQSLITTDCFGLPAGTPATSGLTSCNNTYQLTNPTVPSGGTAPPANPKVDAAC